MNRDDIVSDTDNRQFHTVNNMLEDKNTSLFTTNNASRSYGIPIYGDPGDLRAKLSFSSAIETSLLMTVFLISVHRLI